MGDSSLEYIKRLEKRLDSLEKDHEKLKTEYRQLKKDYKELEFRFLESEQKNQQLQNKITKLESRLRQYEGPNAPSSQQPVYLVDRENTKDKRQSDKTRGGKKSTGPKEDNTSSKPTKRGQKKGHLGSTTVRPPDRREHHRVHNCEGCGFYIFDQEQVKTHAERSISLRVVCEVVEHIGYKATCSQCSHETVKRPPTINGTMFDADSLKLLSGLWYDCHATLKGISLLLEGLTGHELSESMIHNGISQAANLLIPEAEGIKEEVLIHRHPRMDETGYAVVINNREVRWVWAFSTESAVFYRFHESRGADILKEYWPNGDVVPVSDGWRAYNHFEQLQRCWAHFLRHLENAGKKCDQALQLFLGFQQIYHDIKLFRRKRPEDHHEFPAIKLQAMVRINDLIDHGSSSKTCELLKGALVHIENAKDQLLTALDYPELVLDNNLSERNLRKIVIHRKIRGYVASEQGIINLSTFATVFETWRMRKINPYDELEKILKLSAY
jgi:hypothetical protein